MKFSEPLALLKHGCHSVANSYPNSSSALSAFANAYAERGSWTLGSYIIGSSSLLKKKKQRWKRTSNYNKMEINRVSSDAFYLVHVALPSN